MAGLGPELRSPHSSCFSRQGLEPWGLGKDDSHLGSLPRSRCPDGLNREGHIRLVPERLSESSPCSQGLPVLGSCLTLEVSVCPLPTGTASAGVLPHVRSGELGVHAGRALSQEPTEFYNRVNRW